MPSPLPHKGRGRQSGALPLRRGGALRQGVVPSVVTTALACAVTGGLRGGPSGAFIADIPAIATLVPSAGDVIVSEPRPASIEVS